MSAPDKSLIVQSIVAARDGKPYVQIMLDGKDAQFHPEQAREFGMQLINAAAAAESDAAIHRFIGRMGGGQEATAAAMMEYRKVRQESEANPARSEWGEV